MPVITETRTVREENFPEIIVMETETTEIVILEAVKEDLMTAARTRATVTLMVPETTIVLHVRARDVREEITVTVTVR